MFFAGHSGGVDWVSDAVIDDLDTAIGQEGLKPVPVIMDVIQLFAQPGFCGDLAVLRLQPIAEGRDQWRTAGLTGRQSLAGGDADQDPLGLGSGSDDILACGRHLC